MQMVADGYRLAHVAALTHIPLDVIRRRARIRHIYVSKEDPDGPYYPANL